MKGHSQAGFAPLGILGARDTGGILTAVTEEAQLSWIRCHRPNVRLTGTYILDSSPGGSSVKNMDLGFAYTEVLVMHPNHISKYFYVFFFLT